MSYGSGTSGDSGSEHANVLGRAITPLGSWGSIGLVKLPENSIRVEDPEEEVFLLYTNLSSKNAQDGSQAFTGLGSVDSKQDTLAITFELPSLADTTTTSRLTGSVPTRRHGKKAKPKAAAESRTLEIELAQDKTALRSRKGDTGSVLWRVSVDLARLILQQLCSRSAVSLFDPIKLRECHVLELGAGTGLLSLILAPWVRRSTVTDLDYLLPLIRKNISSNLPHVSDILRPFLPDSAAPPAASPERKTNVDALDWLHLHRTPPASRPSIFYLPDNEVPDLIVAVDCIYNPSLLPAFLDTVDFFSVPGRTKVLVAVELRSEDVIREFLELWTAMSGWEIWRVGGFQEEGWLDPSFVIWIGWKSGGESAAHL